MSDPTLFGISKSFWELINSFAGWFSATGSLVTAGIALYIANRAAKPTAKVSVGHRLIIGPGVSQPYPAFAQFKIVNTGDRPIRVVQIGWRAGLFKKSFAVQMYDETHSSRLPIELSHGQEAVWMVPLEMPDEPWAEQFAKKMLLPHYRSALWSLRGQFFTSIGQEFKAKPGASLIKHIKEACLKLTGNS